MKLNYKGFMYILLSAMGFGAMPLFAVIAYRSGISVPTLLLIRFLLAAMFLFLYIFIKIRKISITKEGLISLIILGGICYTLQSNFYFSSLKFIPSSLASLVLFTYPLFVYILTVLIGHEKFNKKVVLAMIISFVGLFFVLGASVQKVNLMGVALAGAASLVYSVYIVIGNRAIKSMSAIVTTAFVLLFASIGLFILGASTGNLHFDFAKSGWLPILALVFISTILPILTFFKGLEILGTTKTSILSMLEPLFVILFSGVFLRERLVFLQIIGGIVVLVGTAIVVWLHKEVAKT